jgi:hypothetical protein
MNDSVDWRAFNQELIDSGTGVAADGAIEGAFGAILTLMDGSWCGRYGSRERHYISG